MTGVPVFEVHAVAPKFLIGYREQFIAVADQAFGIAPWTEAPIDAVHAQPINQCSPSYRRRLRTPDPGHGNSRALIGRRHRNRGGIHEFEYLGTAFTHAA
jgi:hypothetical protein